MDTSDPDIRFDSEGVCHYCAEYDRRVAEHVHTGEDGRRRLAEIVERIKVEGRGRRYDCIIGVSGGVDSTYTAWQTKRLGLRPLAVHLDNGWDSEVAVANINKVLTKLGIDLFTYVVDWPEFRDLQLAFLRASTPDGEIPSDHAIVACMYQVAQREGTRWVVTGYNVRTESHHSASWSQGHYDWRYIRAVHKQFGGRNLRTFPRFSLWSYRSYMRKMRTLDLLDFVDYNKSEALGELEREFGWNYYGGKHHESIYTRFYQGYVLPRKFGFDKRRSHLSSLVCSGEMSRDEALVALEQEPYPLALQREDRAYVLKKLELSEGEFDAILALPPRTFWDYDSYGALYRAPWFNSLRRLARRLRLLPS